MLALLIAVTLAGPPAPLDHAVRESVEIARVADGVAGDVFWLGLSGSADLFSTALALRHCPDCAEGNPLGFTAESRIALKAAGMLVASAGCYKLRRAGHHKAAAVVRWTVAGAQFTLAAWNVRQSLKH